MAEAQPALSAPDHGPDPGPDHPGAAHNADPQAVRQEHLKDRNVDLQDPTTLVDDVLIWEGSVSLWNGAGGFALGAFLMLLALAGGIGTFWMEPTLVRTILRYLCLGLFLAGGGLFGYTFLLVRSLQFKISTRLIERTEGILNRRTDNLHLGKVKDVEIQQTLVQRLLGIGTIQVYSNDRTDPQMYIHDVPNPMPVYEKLRNAVITLAQTRGIISMDR